jgi:hypothetical protein
MSKARACVLAVTARGPMKITEETLRWGSKPVPGSPAWNLCYPGSVPTFGGRR